MVDHVSISSWAEKEPWQIEFENEAVNDERWSCIVTGLIETKVEDEECLRILTQSIVRGQVPLIHSIKMSDLITTFKNESKSVETRKKTGQNSTRQAKEKQKEDHRRDLPSVSHSSSRFPQILALISNHVKSSDGQYKMPPHIMAYALKYMILEKKDKNCIQRRVDAAIRRKTRESEIKAQIIKKLKGFPEERVISQSDEKGNDKMWRREKFDILKGSPTEQGPLNGPEIFIVLSNFYDPLCFAELRKINVPFVAVIKIENFSTMSGKVSSNARLKKQEWINYFWTEFEEGVTRRITTNLYKDIALLKYTPVLQDEYSAEEKSAMLVNDLIATLYGAYQLDRLHQSYIQQMQVHTVPESLEPVDLSQCEMYNKLCDTLVTEDAICEIFVLFSIIEQVVYGVPETKTRTSDCGRESSDVFTTDSNKFESHTPAVTDRKEEPRVTLDYLSEPVGPRERNKLGTQSNNPIIYLYDDFISLNTSDLDKKILKVEEIFKRFVINAILPKISIKFPKLTPAEKTKSDFQFSRILEKNNETEENFKIKLFFSIAMRLMERTQVFEGGCENLSSSSALSRGSDSESERTESHNGITLPPDEPVPGETFFQNVSDLFYARTKAGPMEKKETSEKATIELRKAEAFPELVPTASTSLENLEVACGRCQKLEVRKEEKTKDEQDNVTFLEQLMDSYEISYLNEPNLLVNRKEFEAFVAKYNFYEILEPNRSVQRLQQLYDNYNTTEYTYFSPTDTLFILGHNDADFRGVYHLQEKGFVDSPLSLRDFFVFILPENRRWMEKENMKYISFLKGVKEKIVAEEERKDHEFKCEFLKEYYAMTATERETFLKGGRVDNARDTKKRSMSDNRPAEEINLDDLEDLPAKDKQSQPERFRFSGLNFGDVRVQVNIVRNEFHSDDGSMVGIKKLSWLYGASVVTLTIHRMGSKLYLHKWMEGDIKKESLHFKGFSGTLVTFDTNRSFPFSSKITWPNGLIIEPLPVKGLTSFYIKQAYLEKYRIEEDIAAESSRCFLPNGQILIFRANETIDVFCSSGTKHRCEIRAGEKQTDDLKIRIIETVTPSGEVWVVEDCSKCRNLDKRMILLMGVDPETKETYYRREEGTNCMLWPDGKLVTSYPDGTKITSKPDFEKEEIFIDENIENTRRGSERVKSKARIIFADDAPDIEESSGFVVVTCSYLMEHPKYSTVFFSGSKLEMRMPERMRISLTQTGTYKIESNHSVLKASSENVEFYNVCSRCNKKSISTVYLKSSDKEVLCKTKDYFDKKFIVYGSGQILHKSKEEDLVVGEYEDERSQSSIFANQKSPDCCEHHKLCKPFQRCLVVERDLTGIEFINDRSLYRYIGNLSEDTYYDLCRMSEDGIRLQHAFFDPACKIGRERYMMKYEENDSYPTQMTRKQLVEIRPVATRATTKEQSVCFRKKEKSKLIIARFIRVIHPDPVTVMQIITNSVALYQKMSNEVTKIYRKHSKEGKQVPFAKYVAKELQLIASTLCKSLDLYSHTCTTMPCTEMDIHSVCHRLDLNSYFRDISPDDLRLNILPRCRQILNPFRHAGIDEDIPEHENSENS